MEEEGGGELFQPWGERGQCFLNLVSLLREVYPGFG